MKIFIISIILALITNTLNCQINLDSGLIVYFPLNGDLKDYSGNERNGLINGPILSSDMYGKMAGCYFFDGKNDFISFPTDSLMIDVFTYSVWAFPSSLPDAGQTQYVIAVGGESGGTNIALTNTNLMQGWFGGSYNFGSPMLTLISTSEMPLEAKWYHLVLVRDSFQMRLYINGILNQNIRSYNGFNDSTHGTKPNWGISPGGTLGTRMAANFFHGKIDEVKIYNRVLTNKEILALYNKKVLNSGIQISEKETFDFTIYPIPTFKTFYINTSVDLTYSNVKIYNIQGKQIDFELSINDFHMYEIDLINNLQSGMFIIEINIDGNSYRRIFQII